MLGHRFAATLPTSLGARLVHRGVNVRMCFRVAPAAQWRLYATADASKSSATKEATKPKSSAKKPVTKAKKAVTKKSDEAKKAKAAKAKEKKAATKKRQADSKAKKAALTKAAKLRKAEREAKKAQNPRILKLAALSPPQVSRTNAYALFTKAQATPKPEGVETKTFFVQHAKDTTAKWHALSQAQRDQYIKQAHEKTVQSRAQLAEWLESQDAATIKTANAARTKLRKLGVRGDWRRISGARKVSNGYAIFTREQSTGRKLAPGQSLADLTRQSAAKWKALGDAEKERYNRIAASEYSRSSSSSPASSLASASA